MGITDRIGKVATDFQVGVKNSSVSFLTFMLKLITAFVIGLTVALIGQEISGDSRFFFILWMVVSISLVIKVIGKWTFGAVVLFDLFCILVALLLRMYILLAP